MATPRIAVRIVLGLALFSLIAILITMTRGPVPFRIGGHESHAWPEAAPAVAPDHRNQAQQPVVSNGGTASEESRGSPASPSSTSSGAGQAPVIVPGGGPADAGPEVVYPTKSCGPRPCK